MFRLSRQTEEEVQGLKPDREVTLHNGMQKAHTAHKFILVKTLCIRHQEWVQDALLSAVGRMAKALLHPPQIVRVAGLLSCVRHSQCSKHVFVRLEHR